MTRDKKYSDDDNKNIKSQNTEKVNNRLEIKNRNFR